MYIEGFQNIYNNYLLAAQQNPAHAGSAANALPQSKYTPAGIQGVVVEISREAKEYSEKLEALKKTEGCETCKNRRYVDASSDSTVSYQSPAKINPEEAASKVMAHEQEHVTNETIRAEQNDRKVISHSVNLQTSICPECGKLYVSGGTTRVLTADDKKPENTEEDTLAQTKGASADNTNA